jgi:hypothetical protein
MLMKSSLLPAFEGALGSYHTSRSQVGLDDPTHAEDAFCDVIASLARAFLLRGTGILFFTNVSVAPLAVKSITVGKDNRVLTVEFDGETKPVTITYGKYRHSSSHPSEMVFHPYNNISELPTCCFKYMTETSFDVFKE